MLKALIVEDNPMGAALLKNKIQKLFPNQFQIVGMTATIEDSVHTIKTESPKLVFLDIHLMDGDGFEVLEQTKDHSYAIIFTTAYGEYSLKAFDYAALHYLMKPIDENELQTAVGRFLEQQKAPAPSDAQNQVALLKKLLTSNYQQIAIPSSSEILFVDVHEIVFLEADSSYAAITLANGKKVISTKPLGFYDKLLKETHFFRIHDKYMVNIKRVRKYMRGKGGNVTMDNGQVLPVSVRKKNDFIQSMSNPLL